MLAYRISRAIAPSQPFTFSLSNSPRIARFSSPVSLLHDPRSQNAIVMWHGAAVGMVAEEATTDDRTPNRTATGAKATVGTKIGAMVTVVVRHKTGRIIMVARAINTPRPTHRPKEDTNRTTSIIRTPHTLRSSLMDSRAATVVEVVLHNPEATTRTADKEEDEAGTTIHMGTRVVVDTPMASSTAAVAMIAPLMVATVATEVEGVGVAAAAATVVAIRTVAAVAAVPTTEVVMMDKTAVDTVATVRVKARTGTRTTTREVATMARAVGGVVDVIDRRLSYFL